MAEIRSSHIKEVILNKKAKDYINSLSDSEKKKLLKAISALKNFEGDIKKMKGLGKGTYYSSKKMFRLKVEHYRILFYVENNNIYVDYADTRTNMKQRKCGFFSGV